MRYETDWKEYCMLYDGSVLSVHTGQVKVVHRKVYKLGLEEELRPYSFTVVIELLWSWDSLALAIRTEDVVSRALQLRFALDTVCRIQRVPFRSSAAWCGDKGQKRRPNQSKIGGISCCRIRI
jgi:hypothetical protein